MSIKTGDPITDGFVDNGGVFNASALADVLHDAGGDPIAKVNGVGLWWELHYTPEGHDHYAVVMDGYGPLQHRAGMTWHVAFFEPRAEEDDPHGSYRRAMRWMTEQAIYDLTENES